MDSSYLDEIDLDRHLITIKIDTKENDILVNHIKGKLSFRPKG